MKTYSTNLYLAHHGILGQKWGVRRFQNYDGTRTEEGKARYSEYIKKGSTVKRYSSAFDKDIPTKAGLYTFGRNSANDYKNMARTLPSVTHLGDYNNVNMATLTSYKFKKDARLLDGESAIKSYMEAYGNTKLKDIDKKYDVNSLVYNEKMKDAIQKHSNKTVSEVYKDLKNNDDKRIFAHNFIHLTSYDKFIDENGEIYSRMENFANVYKSRGYDVIVDPEDFSGGFDESYLVLDPSILRRKTSSIVDI